MERTGRVGDEAESGSGAKHRAGEERHVAGVQLLEE